MRNNLVKLYKAPKMIQKAQDIPEKLDPQSFSICLKQDLTVEQLSDGYRTFIKLSDCLGN